eukprot:3970788-Amphidinium_carterae.2
MVPDLPTQTQARTSQVGGFVREGKAHLFLGVRMETRCWWKKFVALLCPWIGVCHPPLKPDSFTVVRFARERSG